MKELLNIKVTTKYDGLKIKEILLDYYQVSRKSLSKIKNNNGIYLNGNSEYVSVRVKKGDLIQIYIEEETSEDIIPQSIPVNIIYEDDSIAVINKPAGIVVHPTRSHYLGTIANGLLYYWQEKGEYYRFRPVNRLDKDTSGLFIVAKNQFSHHKLSLQLQNRKLKRTYHAIVHGNIKENEGTIDTPILKDKNHPTRRTIVNKNDIQLLNGVKSAVTNYRVLKRFKDFTLVELHLLTGRTHQIRIHMSSINHSLVGDELYGGSKVSNLTRQALHAVNLEFFHPITDEAFHLSSSYPDDIRYFLEKN